MAVAGHHGGRNAVENSGAKEHLISSNLFVPFASSRRKFPSFSHRSFHVFARNSVLPAYSCPTSVPCSQKPQCRRSNYLLLCLLPSCCFCKGERRRTEPAVLADKLWPYRVRVACVSWRGRYRHQCVIHRNHRRRKLMY